MVLFPLKNNHSPTFPKDHLSFLTLRSFFTITPVFKDRVLLAKKIPRREAFHLTLGGGRSNREGLWVWQSSCGSSASHPPAEGPSDVPVAQLVQNPPARQEAPVRSLGREDPLEKGSATHSSILELPWCLSWERVCLQGGRPGLGRSPGEGKGPLQYSGPENPMDCIVRGVAVGQD